MKIFNISDVETKLLKQRKLVNHTVVVGKQLLSPGASVEVPDDVVQAKLECIDELITVGVLAKGAPPKGYVPAPKPASAADVVESKTPAEPTPAPTPSKSAGPKAKKSSE